MTLLQRWWRQPDHFEWLSSYLHARGMARPVRLFFATASMSFVLLPVDGWLRRGDFDDAWPVAIEATCAVIGVVVAVMWCRAWPTRRRSLVFASIGSATVVLWSLLQTDHAFGLLICATLTFSGGYFALFHTPPFTVWNLLAATTGAGVNAVMLARQGELFHAAIGLWIVVAMNTVAPVAAQSLYRALGADLSASERDPLTGLLNRRTLYQGSTTAPPAGGRPRTLCITMVDLDNFKRLNDTRGHNVGDEALVEVARVLRDAVTDQTLLYRFGGEEFLAVELSDSPHDPVYPELVCARIADLSYGISASVGCAATSLGGRSADRSTIDDLIARADKAMYEAKRLGGNRVVRHS